MGVQANPKTTQTAAVALGCLPEFEGKSLRPETPNIRFGAIDLNLTQKPPL